MGDPEHGNLDYLQLRKDTLKIPKQFYLRKELSEKLSNQYNSGVGEFLKYTTNEGSNASGQKAPSQGGHPLVPKLNLPRPDPND